MTQSEQKPSLQGSRVALVVPHTHWDRAWYWPFERFRGKLMELWDILLREFDRVPDYRYSTDGQTAMVEDFLEARPESRDRMARIAQTGRLCVGPCYVQPDSFLTGAEAQIRNALLGMEFARGLGGEACLCRLLHFPDVFGITIETPALVAGLGLTAFSFMRGHPEETPGLTDMQAGSAAAFQAPPRQCRFFWWESPDGSRIRVVRLRDGYANLRHVGRYAAPGVPVPALEQEMAALLEAVRKQDDGQGEPFLLLAGSDHAFPPTGLPPVLAAANQGGEYRFLWATLSDLADGLCRAEADEWFVHRGEFHGAGAASVLGGTITARPYLKQMNAALERALTHGVEPLHAAATLLGRTDPAAPLVKAAWKTLLKTHQHDSICGCSVDAVHRADEACQITVAEAADGLRRRGFNRLFEAYGMNRTGDNRFSFALFNPQGGPVRGMTRMTCDFEGLRVWGDLPCPDHYRVVDEAGLPVPFREVSRGRSVAHPHEAVILEVAPLMPPASLARFYLEPAEEWPLTRLPAPASLENEFLRATLGSEGRLTLNDKRTGRSWSGLGYFSAQPDGGDEYDFADDPAYPERTLADSGWQVQAGAGCHGLQVVVASTILETLGEGGVAGSMPVTVEWSLAAGWRHIEARIRFTNQMSGWRLRWNLALPGRPAHTRAGMKFQEIRRAVTDAPPAGPAPRVHPEHPADHFVAADMAGGSGIALYSEFPVNYEVCPGDPCRLAVTLLRAVGWLCNPKPLTTRLGNHAGPHTATPEAQCLGRTSDLRLALRAYDAGEADALFMEAARWRTPPVAGQCDATMRHPERAAEARPVNPAPLYECEGDALFVHSLKRAHDESAEGVVLRLARLAPEAGAGVLKFADRVEVTEVDLAEQPVEPSTSLQRRDERTVGIRVPAWGLRSLLIRRRD